jgi:hypothetical protein
MKVSCLACDQPLRMDIAGVSGEALGGAPNRQQCNTGHNIYPKRHVGGAPNQQCNITPMMHISPYHPGAKQLLRKKHRKNGGATRPASKTMRVHGHSSQDRVYSSSHGAGFRGEGKFQNGMLSTALNRGSPAALNSASSLRDEVNFIRRERPRTASREVRQQRTAFEQRGSRPSSASPSGYR